MKHMALAAITIATAILTVISINLYTMPLNIFSLITNIIIILAHHHTHPNHHIYYNQALAVLNLVLIAYTIGVTL